MFGKNRNRVVLDEHQALNTTSTDYPGNFPGTDDSWNFAKFKKGFRISVVKLDDNDIEFDIIGLDVSIINAYRRILIAEVPTIAIEKVFIYNNTCPVKDEILSHRLGLIPLKADPRLFEYKRPESEENSAEDTLEFQLNVKCTKNPNAPSDATDVDELYKNNVVYTKHLKWVPIGDQKDRFTEDQVGPVFDDIIISKMRPGHEINLKMTCVKGIGKDHAKFSPVATASYRLMPEIELQTEYEGDCARRLQSCFSDGVIKIERDERGREVARVANARKDTCSRNVFRYPELKDGVRMTKIKDHVIFSVESTGAVRPDDLVCEAIKVLRNKCLMFLNELKNVR